MLRCCHYRRAVLVLTTTVVLGCSRQDLVDPPAVPDEDRQSIIDGNNALCLTLYPHLSKQATGNFIYSPLSLTASLSMVHAGARGQTAQQIAQVLQLNLTVDKLAAVNARLQYELVQAGQKDYRLDIANAIWAQKGDRWRSEFLELMKKSYQAGFQQVDFRNHREQARAAINEWAAKRSRGMIKELIPLNSFGPETSLVLANAVYFKADWLSRFNKNKTVRQPFYRRAKDKIEVPLMNMEGAFELAEIEDCQVLDLPFKGRKLSLVVFLPREIDGLRALEKKWSLAKFLEGVKALKSEPHVSVTFPKLRIESTVRMANALKALGMNDAFIPQADFSGLTDAPGEDFFLLDAFQKTLLEVDEEGAKAATVSVFEGKKSDEGPAPQIFRADHPFLFLIRRRTDNLIVFAGRVTDPVGRGAIIGH